MQVGADASASPLRILSLLPSATEIVYALGLEDDLVGVTHECDWPPAARAKPAVTRSLIPPDATSAEIDALVSASMDGGPPSYALDDELIQSLAPDLVLTQDLCAVCAVPAGDVDAALDRLGCRARSLSLDPATLDDVLDDVRRVGEATGCGDRASAVVTSLRERVASVLRSVTGRPRPRVFALEWADPPFNAGHWVPGMIELAGGEPVLAAAGTPSVRIDLAAVRRAAPDVVVFMPCGYPFDKAVDEGRQLLDQPDLADVPAVFAAYGDAYFSRPGPRLVDGVEILAAVLHPGARPAPPADAVVRLR